MPDFYLFLSWNFNFKSSSGIAGILSLFLLWFSFESLYFAGLTIRLEVFKLDVVMSVFCIKLSFNGSS